MNGASMYAASRASTASAASSRPGIHAPPVRWRSPTTTAPVGSSSCTRARSANGLALTTS